MNDGKNTGATPASRRGALMAGVGVAAVLAGAGYAWMRSRKAPESSAPEGPFAASTPQASGGGVSDEAAAEQFWAQAYDTPQGAKLAMASFKGKPLILNFWATWCAPCIEEMPMLEAFHKQRSGKGLQLLGLAIDQPTSVRKYLEKTVVTYPIGLAGFGGTELTKTLGNTAGGLPFSVLFDKEGKLRQRKIGRLSEADLQAWAGLA